MLRKEAKSKYLKYVGRGAAVLFAAEVLAFSVSYGCYYKLNTDQDFRLYMRDNYTPVLDLYYKVGERLGDYQTRQKDSDFWTLSRR